MDYSRQLDLINPIEHARLPLHIIGCGAVGSWLALFALKTGFECIHLYDFDNVEAHNLPNQFFTADQIGQPKVTALAANLAIHNPAAIITPHNAAVDQNILFDGDCIVFMVVDSMKVRKEVYEGAIKLHHNVKLFVETRMGLSHYYVYAIDPCNLNHCVRYEQTLYSDEKADQSMCSASKTVAVTAAATAQSAIWKLIKLLTDAAFFNVCMVDLKSWNVVTFQFDKRGEPT